MVQHSDHRWVLAGAAVAMLGSLFGVCAGFRARLAAETPPPPVPPLTSPAAEPGTQADTTPVPARSRSVVDQTFPTDVTPQPPFHAGIVSPAPQLVVPEGSVAGSSVDHVLETQPFHTPQARAPQSGAVDEEVPPTELVVRGYSLNGQPNPPAGR